MDLLSLTVADVTHHTGQALEEVRGSPAEDRKGCSGGPHALRPEGARPVACGEPQTSLGAAVHQAPWRPEPGDLNLAIPHAGEKVGGHARLDPAVYSSHSLRRTKAAFIYEQTRNVEAVRELLGGKARSWQPRPISTSASGARLRSPSSLRCDQFEARLEAK